MMQRTPPELVEQAIWHLQVSQHTELCFQTLVSAYRGQIQNYYRHRGLDPWDAEDLTQECFLAVAVGIGNYHWRSPIRSWLLGVASNRYRSWLRRRSTQRRGSREVPLTNLASRPQLEELAGPESLKQAIHHQRRLLLGQAIRTLPVQMRRCTRLYYYDQHNTREIARPLGLCPATVRVQLHRARHLLTERVRAQACHRSAASIRPS